MIRSYHEFNNWQLQALPTDKETEFTFGFELEIEKGENGTIELALLSNILENRFGNLFVHERDGSLVDGFEIISQPMTWNWFTSNISTIRALFAIINKFNYSSHNGGRCGLHVHVSRKSLLEESMLSNDVSEITRKTRERDVIVNICYVLERYQKEIVKFTRRKSTTYCRARSQLTTLGNGTEVIDKDLIKTGVHFETTSTDRRKNLNLKNSKTIEFRIFRGTLVWETFLISLNLVRNIVNNAKIEQNVIDLEKLILTGLKPKHKKYAKEYCEQRELIDLNEKHISLDKFTRTVNVNDTSHVIAVCNAIIGRDN